MSIPAPVEPCCARLRLDVACGLSLLTRLPVTWLLSPAQRASTAPWPMRRSLWCWPLIGTAIGALTGAVFWLLRLGHVAALPAAGLALAVQCVLTGGLHEDGLADMADGCGGHSREHRLEIMRDSRIGSYGVMALCLSLLVRAAAMAALPAGAIVLVLAVSGCLARAALLVLPACLRPARPDGLARSLCPLPLKPFRVGLILAGLCATGLVWGIMHTSGGLEPSGGLLVQEESLAALGKVLPPENWLYGESMMTLRTGLVAMGAALTACLLVAGAARRLLGGYTGDVLGAAAVLTECCVLAGFTALL